MMFLPRIGYAGMLALLVVLFACERANTVTGTAQEEDYTLQVAVTDRFLGVGDQTTLRLSLRRTDNSNLPRDLHGVIHMTTSAHGHMSASELPFLVADDATEIFQAYVVFTAQQPGVAEVRTGFLDATVLTEIVISERGW